MLKYGLRVRKVQVRAESVAASHAQQLCDDINSREYTYDIHSKEPLVYSVIPLRRRR